MVLLGIDTNNTILEPSHVDVALSTPKDMFVNVSTSRNTSMLLTLKFQVVIAHTGNRTTRIIMINILFAGIYVWH